MDKDFKDKITKQSSLEDKTISEYIRNLVNNELTKYEISQNQSYLYETLNTIINNILNEELNQVHKILETIYLKQELLIYLLKKFDNNNFEKEIEEFTTLYQGDNLRTIL